MSAGKPSIAIADIGIANVLARLQLAVPLNQRRYDWEVEYVEQLLHDLTKAFDARKPIYFLGAIVLTEGQRGFNEVADGQQRLATTSIFLAAIRDYLLELNDEAGANQYQSEYLIKYDPPSGEHIPKLRLNVEDDNFFLNTILLPPKQRAADAASKYKSNERIQAAAQVASQHVRNITAALPVADKAKRLYDWIEFLRDKAIVVSITVPSHISDSFRMFETLNARGLRASQVDILKNYLFGKTPETAAKVHPKWISMLSTIESYGGDKLLLNFLRHFWISRHGPTTHNELGESIENTIVKESQAVDLVSALDKSAVDYVALLSPLQHPRWVGFPKATRTSIDILTNQLEAVQIRPLMLAVTSHFSPEEAQKAFQLFISWSVRFLIVGGGGGGKLDRYYGTRAQEVTAGKIKSVKQLAASMAAVVPGDQQFREEFASANVRSGALARYYLRALELHGKEKLPQLLINQDPDAVNVEHVMPVTPSEAWKIDAETAATFHKKLGNMVLLGAKENVAIGNGPFTKKKPVLAESPYTTTKDVAKRNKWGPEEIRTRQAGMADLAPKVWPL